MSQRGSAVDRPILDHISKHGRQLPSEKWEQHQSSLHEDVCARRQIEFSDQKLRSFVVRHSVLRIHCVSAFAIVTMTLTLAGPMRADVFGGTLMLTSVIVVASMRNISTAISPRRIGR